MKFTARELILAWITATVVLLAVTYVLCRPGFDSVKTMRTEALEMDHRIEKEEGLVARRADWERRLDDLRAFVGPIPKDRPPESFVKRTAGALAAKNSIRLRDLNTGKEESQGGLHVLPLSCPWEGNTVGIVNLLLDFAAHDVMFDVSELSIRSSGKDDLRGSFTVNCAYTE